jgi:hypothetical protein
MSQAYPSQFIAPQAHRPARLVSIAALTVGLALVLPYVAIDGLGAAIVRTVYPVYVLAAACLIMKSHRPLYPGFILAVFAFCPFLRRVADYQAGFAAFNPILLAPYAGLLPTVPALIRRPFRMPSGLALATMSGCIVYGVLLAMFRMTFLPVIYEGIRWLLPISLCAFIMERPEQASEMRRNVMITLGTLLPILTIYGIYQFLYAPLWDVFWLSNIDNPTFGEGEPYKIRVWSMMNSPGSAAIFTALAMILLAGESVLGMAIATFALPLLALTVIRSAWIQLAIGLAVMFWRATPGRRLTLVAGVAAIGVAAASVLANPALPSGIRNVVTDRFATFSDLKTDTSTYDRLRVYQSFFDRLSASPWGEGFGVNASTVTARETRGQVTSIDSGLLEAYLIYGVPVGTLYFLALFATMRQAWASLARLPSRFMGYGGVIISVAATLPLGSSQIGETGVLLWVALGLAVASDPAGTAAYRRQRLLSPSPTTHLTPIRDDRGAAG